MILTLTIVWMVLIALACAWYWAREWLSLSAYRKALSPYSSMLTAINLGNEGLLEASNDLVRRCFVLKKPDVTLGNLVISQGRYVLRDEVYNLVPEKYASHYKFVPALLTTAGVLGTFVGISVALMGLSDISDTEKLLNAASGLMGGMRTAFWTSVAGMATSLAFMLVISSSNRHADKQRLALEDQFIQVAAVPSHAELMLGETSEKNNDDKQVEILGEISRSNLASQQLLLGLVESARDNTPEKLSVMIGEVIRRVNKETLGQKLDDMHKFDQKSHSEMIHQLQTGNSLLVKSLNALFDKQMSTFKSDVFTPLASELKSLNGFNAEISASLHGFKSSLTELTEKLGDTSDVLNQFQKQTMNQLLEFADKIESTFSGFKSSIEATMSNIQGRMDESFSKAELGMTHQREAFEASANDIAAAFENQVGQLESIGQKAKTLMDNASDSLANGLADVDSKIRAMAEATQSELEHFRKDYQANLEQFFDQQANLLEGSLGKQRDGLASVVDDFKTVFITEHEKRLKQYEEIHAAEKSLKELVEMIKATELSSLSQVTELSRNLGSQVSIMTKEYKEANTSFKNMIENMPKAMESWFEKASETQEKYFENFDGSANQVYAHLVDVANILYDAAQHKHDSVKVLG